MTEMGKRIHSESKAIAREFIWAQPTAILCALLAYAQDGGIDWYSGSHCVLGFVGADGAEGFVKLNGKFPKASLAFGHLMWLWSDGVTNTGNALLSRRVIAMVKAELRRRERANALVPAATETVST